MRDWEDGPEDAPEPPLTQREVLETEITYWEALNLLSGSRLTHLRTLLREIELRPAARVVEMPKRRVEDGVAVAGEVSAKAAGAATATVGSHALALGTARAEAGWSLVPGSGGGTPSPPVGRKPSLVEYVASGAVGSGGDVWWEHREYLLKDGQWGANVHVYRTDERGITAIPIYPPVTQAYWPTREQARAVNVQLAKWYISVNPSSPQSPSAFARTS